MQLNSRESIEDFTLQLLQFINTLIPSHNANSISKYKQKLQNAKNKERVVDNSSKAEGTHLLIKLSDKRQGYDNHEALANLLIPCILMAGTTPFNTRVIVGYLTFSLILLVNLTLNLDLVGVNMVQLQDYQCM